MNNGTRVATVLIEEAKVYTLTIAGEKSDGWKLDSSWNGMEKYVRGNEQVIVDCDQTPLSKVFGDIFPSQRAPVEANVIKASPEVFEKLAAAQEKNDAR